ncbi:MAG: LssY C-terminal domain-containing protein [Methylovirgula sp.]
MRHLIRLLQRAAILALGAFAVWLIVFVIFRFAHQKLPLILAFSATYLAAAYVVLPYGIRMGLKILHRKHVPRYTITGDGLPGDPINLALVGDLAQLRAAFAAAGWAGANRLDLKSSWGMVRAFVFNRPYPTAPFSPLYLFGRSHDIGFQQAIGDSPRKRHHVRFWAKSLAQTQAEVTSARFWLNKDRPDENERVIWLGAATRDTGFSLTQMTFQITHATDSDTNAERAYIIGALTARGAIGDAILYKAGDHLPTKVNRYITDGDVAMAELAGERAGFGAPRIRVTKPPMSGTDNKS